MNIGKLFYVRFYIIWTRLIFGIGWNFKYGWDVRFHFGFFNVEFSDPLEDD